jgi:hypothetical protein
MMKALWLAAALLATMSAASAPRAQTTLLRDDFDKEAAGVLPRHWKLEYNGAGTSLQVLDTAQAFSKPNSLKLVSGSCWVGEVYHPITLPTPIAGVDQHVQITARVFISGVPTGGCNPNAAGLALCNPAFATYGTFYATIYLTQKHGITVGPSFGGGPPPVPVAKKYGYGRWNKLLIDADLTAKTADYYVNNVPVATGIALAGSGQPNGICLDAGDSGPNTTAWFDNVLVQIPAAPSR